uniref:Uncharacterized protein n=1 Tax=Xiphophorus couchianus TaxID=32473 RepID=A0A3B5LVX4_9TELE
MQLNESVSSNGTSGPVQRKYNYDSWMVLLSQLPLLLFTLLNSLLYQWVKERLRVAFSLVVIFLLFALTAALVQVDMQPDNFFSVTMATIWFFNVFSAVLQGSLFGMVGLFPPRYSTVFMSGQGLAGIFAGVAMLCSIMSKSDPKSAALGYFVTPCLVTLGALLCYLLLPHLVNQFLWLYFIWLMALCVTFVFAVTLSVFPVITVRVKTIFQREKENHILFTCVCCILVFNIMDLAGRSAPSLFQWPSKQSRLFPVAVLSRLVFIPLLMMCNIPNSKLTVLFRHDSAFVVIMALFSFSNGYLATLCMAYTLFKTHFLRMRPKLSPRFFLLLTTMTDTD